MRGRASRAGFTLIELLVVISIIAVLAGLVMTATMKVRQQSRKVQCASNLRQIGIASQLYLNEYRIFPFNYGEVSEDKDDPFGADEDSVSKGFQHIQLLFNDEMLDNPEVAICGASTDQPASADAQEIYQLKARNCSYNWTKRPRGDGDKSTLPLAADKREKDKSPKENNHRGGRNVLNIDGSVKWLSSKAYKNTIAKYLTEE